MFHPKPIFPKSDFQFFDAKKLPKTDVSISDSGSSVYENKIFARVQKQQQRVDEEGSGASTSSHLFEVKSLKKDGSSSSDNTTGPGFEGSGFEEGSGSSEGLDLWSDTSSVPYMKRSDRYKKLEAKYNLIDREKPGMRRRKYGRKGLMKLFCF